MIHLYYTSVSGDCSDEQSLRLYKLLPEERKEKIKNTRNAETARKRLYTGAFLQYVLYKETGIPMQMLSYLYGDYGKPELDYTAIRETLGSDDERKVPQIHFSLSHSGEYAVLAVSDQPVGIDIEHKKKNCLSVAKRCFCQEEYEDILGAGTDLEQEKRFLEYWTMKEAWIKHSGEGLHIPLNSFRIVRRESGISTVRWKTEEIMAGKGQDGAFSGRKCTETWLTTFFLEAEPYCISLCSESLQDLECINQSEDGSLHFETMSFAII